jgi:hypothetical protein
MPIPATQIRTSHAISIRVGGTTIGQIQSWAPNQSRVVNPVYEINAVGVGDPFENAPGIAMNLTIQVAWYDLLTSKMEEVWGTKNSLWMLTQQHNPIDIEEKWIRFQDDQNPSIPWLDNLAGDPFNWQKKTNRAVENATAGILGNIGEKDEFEGLVTGAEYYVEKFWYSGCWFTQLGRNMQAQGDRIVMVNATLQYSKVRPL